MKSLLSFTLPKLLKFSSIRSVCLLAFCSLLTILSACTSADDSAGPAFTVELSGTALTETSTPLTISTTDADLQSVTLAACADFSAITFTVTDPAAGYIATLDNTASSTYNHDDLSANTQTIDVIIRNSDGTEAALIPITVSLQGCFTVTIASSDLTSDTDPLTVSSGQANTPTATLTTCTVFPATTFAVTNHNTGVTLTGYTAALDSTASSTYNHDDPSANTQTIDVIITRDSAEVARIPITVTLQACYRVTIASSALTPNSLAVSSDQTSTPTATLTACNAFPATTFTVTEPNTGYTAAFDSIVSSSYNYNDLFANTRTIGVIFTATGQSTAAAIIPITVTLQACYRAIITSASSALTPDPLIVSSGQTGTPTATLAACADFSAITFTFTEPTTSYTAALDSTASSVYNYDDPSANANTQTINVIITRTSDSAEVASIPITVTLQACYRVTISSSALTSDTDPLIVSSDQTSTPTATLDPCADFSGITFDVTEPATGYIAAFASTASSDYDYDNPNANANTQTINVIITRTSDSAEVASIPITVTLQACYRVTISSNDLTPDSLTVSSGQTGTPTATLDPCADFSGITTTVTDPDTGYSAALDSTASSDYNYDILSENTQTINVIITRTSDSADVASIPIEVTLSACSTFSVQIAGSTELSNGGTSVSDTPVTVTTGNTPTAFTLAACATFSAITFTVTDPAAGYSAAFASSASNTYNYDDPNANTPRTIDVIITAAGQSTAAASIPIEVTILECSISVEIAGSAELSNDADGNPVSSHPVTVMTGQSSATAFTLTACATFSDITFDVTDPASGYTAAFASSASSDYDYDNPNANANTQDIDVIITTAGQSTAAAIIPISVSLQGCFRVTITSSTLTPNSLAVSSDQANIPTATLDPCVDFSDIIFTVTDPAADYTAALVGNPYYSTTNTMLSAIAITTDGQSTSVATIAIQVQLSECNNFADGDGTSTTTAWEINNDMRLDLMSRLVASSSSYRDDYYKVTANIDLGRDSAPWAESESTGGNVSPFIPIGSDSAKFTGNMDCDGHTISNFYIYVEDIDNIGLFGVIASGAMIANCTLSDAKIHGKNNVGGIVGTQSGGTISNNAVSAASITAYAYAGGIVGTQSGGTISNNAVSGASIAVDDNSAGGIVGYQSNGTISSNAVSGVSITAGYGAGGIVGSQNGGTISHNFSAALVYASSYSSGLVASFSSTINPISNSAFIGVVCTSGGTAGGAVSTSSGTITIETSYVAAKVTGNTSYGLVPSGGTVNHSYYDNESNSSASVTTGAQDTDSLQTPTSATGIYSSWTDTFTDSSSTTVNVWDFGTSSDYPALNGLTLTPAEQRTAGATALALSCP